MKKAYVRIKHASDRDVFGSAPCDNHAQVELRRMVDSLFEHAHSHGVALKLELKIPVQSEPETKVKP